MNGSRHALSEFFTDFGVDVPDDYVVVGGGAEGTNANPGHLLTASYPKANLSGWLVSSKDHRQAHPYAIKAYAIGLRVKGLSAVQLRNKLKLVTFEGSQASLATAQAILPAGYLLVGAGAKVNYSGAGALLTRSSSRDWNVWEVVGKDHLTSDPSTVKAYAIGLPERIPNFGTFVAGWAGKLSSSGPQPSVESGLHAYYALTSCGASASGSGAGQLLWRIAPIIEGDKGCRAASKEHFSPSTGYVSTDIRGLWFSNRYTGSVVCANVPAAKGWSLVSVPILAWGMTTGKTDMSVATLFPNSYGYAYWYNGSTFVNVTTLETGKGYLLPMKEERPAFPPICGQLVAHEITVRAGWNLLGVFENSVDIADIRPSGLITRAVDPSGADVTRLEPGKAYLLLASEAGRLDLP